MITSAALTITAPGDSIEPKSEERLQAISFPFRIRIVRNEEQLARAVVVRAEAYSRHWPTLTERLRAPELQDRSPDSLILLAESKATGEPLGTMRVDTNLTTDFDLGPSVALPANMANRPTAYVTRLGVKQGSSGSLVKLALFKSLHRFCIAKQLAWMLVGVRPPNDRDYVRLGFSDVNVGGRLVPIPSSGGIPVRVMSFDVMSAERNWRLASNPLYNFMFCSYHPDIEIFSSVSAMWSHPRSNGMDRRTSKSHVPESLQLLII